MKNYICVKLCMHEAYANSEEIIIRKVINYPCWLYSRRSGVGPRAYIAYCLFVFSVCLSVCLFVRALKG